MTRESWKFNGDTGESASTAGQIRRKIVGKESVYQSLRSSVPWHVGERGRGGDYEGKNRRRRGKESLGDFRHFSELP